MVKVSVAGFPAQIDSYRWTSKDKALERLLNSMLPAGGPSGSDPNPDYTAALDAVARLGGEVLSYDKTESNPRHTQ